MWIERRQSKNCFNIGKKKKENHCEMCIINCKTCCTFYVYWVCSEILLTVEWLCDTSPRCGNTWWILMSELQTLVQRSSVFLYARVCFATKGAVCSFTAIYGSVERCLFPKNVLFNFGFSSTRLTLWRQSNICRSFKIKTFTQPLECHRK